MQGWRWVFVLLVFVLLTLSIGTFLLWNDFGLREYFGVTQYIKKLPSEEKLQVKESFYTEGEDTVYSGAFAGKLGGKIWVWGRGGLKAFQPDQGSAYSFFSMCTDENIEKIKNKDYQISSTKIVTGNMSEWLSKMKKGDYVLIEKADRKSNGYIREAHGFDWWVFAKTQMNTLCEKSIR